MEDLMQKTMKKVLAVAASLLLCTSASAGEVFSVDPTSLPAVGGATFDAKFMGGTSSTRIYRTAGNNYEATGYLQFGNFVKPGGGNVSHSMDRLGLEYGLYATFTQSFSCPGSLKIGVQCAVTGINLSLYADPFAGPGGAENDFTEATLGSNASVTVNGVDILLATVDTVISGVAGVNVLGGAYENINSNFLLTLAGENYFVDPDPFYVMAFSAFNNTSLGVVCGQGPVGAPVQVNCAGPDGIPASIDDPNLDVIAVNSEIGGTDFLGNQVPEPASLGLLGLGLLGLGAMRRRSA
jgi:hypothetical protein